MNSQEAREATRNRKQQLANRAQDGAGGAMSSNQASVEALIKSPNLFKMLQEVLPQVFTPERMVRLLLTAVRVNKDLAACDQASILACVMTLCQLGLEPNTPLGHAYLIPRKGKCTIILGYQGMIELAIRSGAVDFVRTHAVYEGDTFKVSYGLQPNIEHVPSPRILIDEKTGERLGKQLTHTYAVCEMRNGKMLFEVLDIDDIEDRRARSASNSGPWFTDYVAMARKSTVRALWRSMPKSVEMQAALAADKAGDEGLPPALEQALRARVDALLVHRDVKPANKPDARLEQALQAWPPVPHDAVSPQPAPGTMPGDAPAEEAASVESPTTSLSRDPWVQKMMQAAGCPAEEAARLLKEGWEIDPNTGEAVPPSGGQDDE